MESRLEDLKTRFTCIMMDVHQDVLPDFMWWLDHKLAEYKVYGQMILKGSEIEEQVKRFQPAYRIYQSNPRDSSAGSQRLEKLLKQKTQQSALIPLQNVQKFVSQSSNTKRKQNTPCRRVPAAHDTENTRTAYENDHSSKKLKYSSPLNSTEDYSLSSLTDHLGLVPKHASRPVNQASDSVKKSRTNNDEKHRFLMNLNLETDTSVSDKLMQQNQFPSLDPDYEFPTTPVMDVSVSSDSVVMKSSGRGRKIPFDTSGKFDAEGNGVGYKCDICGAILQYKSGLNRHILRHTSCKDFQCTLCQKLFHRKDNLVIHYKKVHCKIGMEPKPKTSQNAENSISSHCVTPKIEPDETETSVSMTEFSVNTNNRPVDLTETAVSVEGMPVDGTEARTDEETTSVDTKTFLKKDEMPPNLPGADVSIDETSQKAAETPFWNITIKTEAFE